MNMRKVILVILLLAVVALPRLPKLDSFVTIDEPFWLSVGANYYYALGQRELQNTVYEYHPAVTTMWFVTFAFLADFPDFRGLGQGYFDVDKEKFDPFLIEYGHDPLYLLYLSRLFQAAVIILFALVIFFLLSRMFGDEKAFLYTALISSAPYFLGHSRILSHEAMVAFFVMASLFGLLAYLEFERKWVYLFISAASAALAQLTKSSAMAMFPAVALILVVAVLEKRNVQGFRPALMDHLKVFGWWLLQLFAVYFILWPGIWVAPGKMLYEVYGNAFSYAFQGARLQVTQELQPTQFNLDSIWGTASEFLRNIVLHSTPITWIGFILAMVFLFYRGRGAASSVEKKLTVYLLLTAVMFVLLFSAAQGRNSPHYIMTSHVSVDMIAALGWGILFGWMGMQRESLGRSTVCMGGAAALIVIQLGSALAFFPYYYTYFNPLVKPTQSDYGEGFEYAAAYLAEKPNVETTNVLSFRGRGPFSYYYPGRTIILNPLFLEEAGMASMVERMREADYLVINAAFAPRTERTGLFVSALNETTQPEKVIEIKGVSPIYIYYIKDLPPSFYEAISK